LIPNPIRRVLSSIREHRVRALLMGGQACVLYGAAEFSRDTDLLMLADAGNLTQFSGDSGSSTPRVNSVLLHYLPPRRSKCPIRGVLSLEQRYGNALPITSGRRPSAASAC